ncbi:MAG: TIM barrel protein [Pseudomonadota bacterium]
MTTITVASREIQSASARLIQIAEKARPWSLNFVPHIGLSSEEDGMFAPIVGPDPIEQIALIGELGFKGIEDNFMRYRPIDEQRRIAAALEKRDMRLATFVATFATTGPAGSILANDSLTFASRDDETRRLLKTEIKAAAEVSRRFGGGFATVLSGRTDPRLPRDYQTANVIDNLRAVADIAADASLVLGLEPINARQWTGTFVTTVPHGNLIVQGVDHPNIRLIFDAYHVQIETGSILENLELAWDSVGYVQIADAPGRNEPGSGEINYAPIFAELRKREFDGFVGLEHGQSKPGAGANEGALQMLSRL